MFGCNSSFNEEICLPYGTYEACITPPFSQDQGGSFELAYVPEMGNNIYLIQMNGWNNDTAACSDLSVPEPMVPGCMDPAACNYNPEAELDNFTCFYATETTDCDGNCNEGYVADCNGDCGGTAVEDECGDCGGNGPTPGYDCDDNCISQEILFQVDMWGGNATEWSVYDSNGNVVLSGNNPYSYNCDGMYCGDLVCGFNYGECYTFEANGSFDGNVWIYLPTPDQCNGCTQQIAYLDGWSGQTSVNFCVPEECSDDEVLDNTYAYGWSGYDEVSWTITNVLTGEEVMSGDVQMNQTSEFACFEDGIYALTVCDTESGPNNYDDDWYVDICVETGTYNPDQCAYVNGYNFNYGPSGEACETEYFAVNMFMGCMDPLADNYNPYAAYQPDADACIYPCPEESFIIVNANPWGGVDGDETWVITDDATGEVVLSGNIPFTYSDCDVYCGDIECLLPGCYTITTTGDFDGYINISEPSPQCNGCTNYLGEVYSNSSMSFCIGGTDCGDGYEEVYTYGYNVGSYTIEYTDGTVLEMSYTNDWNEVYECIPEGDYTICIDFGGSDNGYFYFGDMYWDAWSIYNGYSNGGDVCVNSTDSECPDSVGYSYYVYAYNDCNVDERTYELTHVETGDVVWSTTMFGCNSSFNEEICLPYGTYEACITPPFSQDQGGSFELAYVPEMGNNIYLIQMNGWNNDTAACSDLSVPEPMVPGCMDPAACNYNPEAELDNFTCFYATETTDCDGNCNEGYVADCNGDCGGTAVEDECGDCGGNGPTPGYDCDDNCISQEILFQVDMWGGNATEWSVYDSNGNVVLSGNNPYSYNCDGMYCGDLVCGFNYGECYTFEANGSFDGNVWIYLPTPDQCNGCTQQIAYLDGWSGQTSVNFCVPEECSDDEVLDNTYAYGWSGYDEVSWTITNVLTGEEVMSGDVQMNQTSEFACFEDGIYALTVCDTESGPNNYDDDWYVDICVETGTYNPDQCAYVNGYNFNYGPSGEACETEYFAVNMFMGCMDPLADNYNPYAAYQPDADACIYPCPEESFIIVNANPWGGVDGDETWVITDDATGEVVLSGNIPFTYSDCDVYCGDIECLLPGCYTITTTGDFDGYINISEPSPQCNGCTNYLGEVYSNSSMSFCIGGTDCGDGYEEVYTYGYNVGSYTIEYTDGTVLEMSYTNDWNEVYECIPEGDYTICIDFGGSDNGYFYFGDMYWDAWSIYNGYSNGGDVCVNSTDSECPDSVGYSYYVYAYNDCNVDERTYELTHVETGDVVWSTTMFGCNSSFNEEICLPYGTYEACITPPFSQDQGGSFELAYVPEMGNNIYLIQMNGWNNDTAACSDLSVPGIDGCTDMAACNYDSQANSNDGSCVYPVDCEVCSGETDGTGYVMDGDSDGDGICDVDEIAGCTDEVACNYDPNATDDDSSCTFPQEVSTIMDGYEVVWTVDCSSSDDGSGTMSMNDNSMVLSGYDDWWSNYENDSDNPHLDNNFEVTTTISMSGNYTFDWSHTTWDLDGSFYSVNGTMHMLHDYWLSGQNEGNGSVVVELQEGDVFRLGVLGEDLCCGNGELTISNFTFPSFGCIDTLACNYNDASTTDDGSCVYPVDCEVCSGETDGTGYVMDGDSDGDGICDVDEIAGCTDEVACNYDPNATDDDSSCTFPQEVSTIMDGYEVVWTVDCSSSDDGSGTMSMNDNSMVLSGYDDWWSNYENDSDNPHLDNNFEVTTTISMSGNYTFDWSHTTWDLDGSFYSVNGTMHMLHDYWLSGQNEGNGSVVVELQEGDVFRLGVLGEDLCCGNGELTISNFTFPSFGCIDTLACNYNDASTTDDGSCVYPVDCEVCSGETDGTGYVMDGDSDGDGICDVDEIAGCTDEVACNYDPNATDDDETCTYSEEPYDCLGNCINDADADGVCDEFEVAGCQDLYACNYDWSATDSDNSLCTYPEAGFDCDGNCAFDGAYTYSYSYDNYLDVIVDMYSSYGPVNFDGTSYLELHINGDYFTDMYFYSADYGWMDEYYYDNYAYAYYYDELDASTYCGDITIEVVWPNAPDGCSNVIYTEVVNLGTSSAQAGYDCLGNCINDADADGVCDEFEVAGCQDLYACNYDWSATDSDNSLCTYPEAGFDCDGNCAFDGAYTYSYSYDNYLDVIVDMYSSYGPVNFDGTSYLELHINGDYFTDMYFYSADYGWMDEYYYDNYAYAYYYDELDASTYCGDITIEVVWPNAPDGCSNVIYTEVVNLGTSSAQAGYDCLGNCINDADADGVCDEFEVAGCQDLYACNYDWSATDSDNSLCTYPEAGFDCDGNCAFDGAYTYSYSYDNYLDVIVDMYSSYGPVNFDGTSYLELHINGDYFTDMYFYSADYGWMDEYYYDNYAYAYYYDELDASTYCGDITIEVVWPNAPDGCSNVIYTEVVNLGTSSAQAGYDCLGNCINDADADGVCDEFEVAGCQDLYACNYDWSATDSDNSLCTYPEAGFDCDGNCAFDGAYTYSYSYDNYLDVIVDMYSSYGPVNFDGTSYLELHINGDYFTDMYFYSADYGWMDEYYYDNYAYAYYYDELDASTYCGDITIEVVWPNAPDGCSNVIYTEVVNLGTSSAQAGYDCLGNCINDADADGVCDEFEVYGCMDDSAINYNLEATEDNGSCVYAILGCTDPTADNFDPLANTDDGSCTFCTNFQALLVANSDISESGASDGYIQATGQGGSSNYDVQVFDANGAQQNPFALAAGDYTVVVTDVNNDCSDELVVTIGEPAVAVDPCDITPSGLFVDNIIHNRVVFNWSAPAEAPSYYMIRYRPVGTTQWTVMRAGPETPNAFTGTSRTRYFHEAATTYEWSMRARMVDEDLATICQSPWSASAEYTTLPQCANLENLAVDNVEANWVTFLADAPDASWGVWQSKGKMREVGTNAYRYVNGGSDGTIAGVLKGNFTASTDYEWHTKAWCTANVDENGNPDPMYHSGWGDFSAFTTEAPCDKLPTNLTTSSNGANTAVIMSWDTPESGAPDHYFLEMTNLTTGAVYEWNYQDGESNSRTKFGQNPGDEISWRIRGACGSNGTSWATIFTQPVTYTLGGARLASEVVSQLDVYPNPSRDIFNVTFTSEEAQTISVKVVNMIGEEIYTEELTDFVGQYSKVVDMNTQPKGVYFLEITTNNGAINQKIVLQ